MNIKKLVSAAAISGTAIASMAVPALAASDNANQQACFGQGRADYAVNGSETVGYYASMRKGDNAAMNAAYRDACQAL